MKPTYSNFEAKKNNSGFLELPPRGAYVAKIKSAKEEDFFGRQCIEITLDITEGEYKGRYEAVWRDQEERFGKAYFKGIFRLFPYKDGDKDYVKAQFEGNLWAVQESNAGYRWDWDEKKLVGKMVGISVRNRLYTYNGKDRSTPEIAEFVPVADVKTGKVKLKPDYDRRKKDEEASTDGSEFTEVSNEVDVPWA